MRDNILYRINDLVEYLNRCTISYDEGNPVITDEEWDKLYFELKDLEDTSGLILGNSPTQTITYESVNSLNKVSHSHKMLSLDKTKNISDIINFLGASHSFITMLKMDGLTCSLTYENGELVKAETRGNGFIGEDILHNAKVIGSIPKQIPYKETLIIDGEIICTYKDFKDFSTEYKNPRNFAAGSIRLLDSKECAKRKLTFVAWEVIEGFDEMPYLDSKLDMIRNYGFIPVPYVYESGKEKLTDELIDLCISNVKNTAKNLDYPIDGAVFKFNDTNYSKSLGETSHHFKNALAYKFYDEVYLTTLLDIEWTMGRTGVLTPVAIFEPIEIDGSTVERASLHNLSVMEETLGEMPHKGQKIEVFKANMIIPQIADADKSEHGTLYYMENPVIDVPEVCPICGGHTIQKRDFSSTFLTCDNPTCGGKLINKLDHFCGKKGLDIKGLSKATLEKLIDWGWISNSADLFTLGSHRDEWIKKPGFGVKSVDKVLSAIEAGSHTTLHQMIASIGIPLIGSTASKKLENQFKTWDKFIEATESNYKFYDLPDFGGEMHYAIKDFDYSEAKYIVEHYITFDVIEETPVSNNNSCDLSGKTFVITGKVSHFKNRDELKALIESLGGKVSGSVSKNTSYLINNDVNSTSSKNKTAQSLGIPILSEEMFIETFGIQ